MSLSKFELMLKTNNIYFFDVDEFEEIISYYLDMGKHFLAHKAIELGLTQHPASIRLKLLKVELLLFNDKTEEAIPLLHQIESLDPNNADVFIHRATILSKDNQHKKAIELLKESLHSVEDPIDIWSMLGMEYLYLDDYDNALLQFKKCIDLDNEDYSSLYNIIHCFEMNEDYNKAITYLNSYINKNPYSEVAWHQLGRQYFMIEDYKKAVTAFDYAIIIDEDFIGGYIEKGKSLEKLGHYKEAIKSYSITLRLDDPTAFVLLRIGVCFEKIGEISSAIFQYKKALKEDPLLEEGRKLLIEAYEKTKQYKKAIHQVKQALEMDDTNPLYWYKYAKINMLLKDYKEAEKGFEKCFLLEDKNLIIAIDFADLLLYINKPKDALQILIKAKKENQELAEIEYRIFIAFMLLNKKEYSLTHLKNALSINFTYYKVIKKIYPTFFKQPSVQNIITTYKKPK